MFLYTKKKDMNWPRGYKSLLILLISGLAAIPSQAQLKLGGSPESTRLDAALEISSHKKGLLLPRVTNAALASNPLDSAAQGMMVFNINDQTLYVKKASGYTSWTKVPDLATYAISNLSDVNFPVLPAIDQLLRYDGTKWSNWTPNYIKTISGDVTAGAVDAAGNVVTTLSNFGTANTYFKVTTDAKGRIQSGATSLVAADIPSGVTHYIQNQNAALQTGDFRINGSGNLASLTVTGLTAQGGLLFTNTGAVTQKAGQLIWDDVNNRLGIGNAAPSVALHVTGDLRVTNLNKTGGILFTSGTTGLVEQKDAQLVWDNTNNRLGIGTGTPAASLDVAGTFKLGTTGTALTAITKVIYNTTANQTITSLTTTQVTWTLPAGTTLKADDNVIVSPALALGNGVGIGWVRVSNAGARQIQVGFVNGSTTNRTINTATKFNIAIISL